ncbi:alpha/beta hydrolase [Pelomonas sp. SE-A7]|uniref:alpha/beta fold hydrolase n=1 Tax=Pelomonas sp. SE-A7 TaxID=3054953 RepID=UPI00259CCF95|nr:alpha/beta hydrolase [Pelomonas sp. SE-A7]MDM4765855.1 alpha/beta fold hydrolase [Pelomonas sp. SE-A7]
MRGWKRWTGPLAACLVLIVGPAAAAEVQQGGPRARIGGHELSWECRGTGATTVLLVEGMGLDARATFRNTFRNFEADGVQVCLYDRAGVGSSSPLQQARPLKALSDELVALAADRQWGQLVLVAHSFGGLVARSVALDHPGLVRGIVFVDAVHESWLDGLRQALSPTGWRTMESIIRWEKDQHSHEDFVEAVQSLTARRKPLTLPVTVLSRGLPHTQIRQARMSYADVDAYNATWDVAQARLAQESSDMRQVRMRHASHLFDEQDPWLVIDEIKALLKRVEPRRTEGR